MHINPLSLMFVAYDVTAHQKIFTSSETYVLTFKNKSEL